MSKEAIKANRGGGIILTEEQLNVMHKINIEKENVCIMAVSGAAKSYTIIESFNDKTFTAKNGVYLVYNKKAQKDVEYDMPEGMVAMTMHALAYKYIVRANGLKVRPSSDFKDFNKLPYAKRKTALFGLRKYCQSDVVKVGDMFKDKQVADAIRDAMNDMIDGTKPITFDAYAKWFQLYLALDLVHPEELDIIVLDEGQDLNPCYYDIFVRYPSKQRVAVGDCLSKHSKIKTSKGWIRLSSVYKKVNKKKEEVFVESLNIDTGKFEFKKVLNAVSTGTKDVYNVKTVSSQLEVTMDHRFLTDNGYKRLKELSVGDFIRTSIPQESKDNNVRNNLTATQRQVVLGSFLGDGSIKKTSECDSVMRLKMCHSEAQKRYLMWKMSAFGKGKESTLNKVCGGKRKIRGVDCNVRDSFTDSTNNFVSKEITLHDVIDSIDLLGIAIWIMDDGSIVSRNKTGEIQGLRISSNAFSENENKLLLNMINNRFDTNGYIRKSREYFEIQFRMEDSHKILNELSEYIHDDFIGKFKKSESTIVDISGTLNDRRRETFDVVTSITKVDSVETMDIEVEDNHNFVASKNSHIYSKACGLVVHNCNQTINEWNGATDALHRFSKRDDVTVCTLSGTMRCTVEMAKYAETFVRKNIDDKFSYSGFNRPIPEKFETSMYISRTNSGLILFMAECMRDGVGFNTARKVNAIFNELLWIMSYAKNEYEYKSSHNGKNSDKFKKENLSYLHAYEDYKVEMKKIDRAGLTRQSSNEHILEAVGNKSSTCLTMQDIILKDGTISAETKVTFNKWLTSQDSTTFEHQSMSRTANIIAQMARDNVKIFDVYEYAKKMESDDNTYGLTLTSGHSSKGGTSCIAYFDESMQRFLVGEMHSNLIADEKGEERETAELNMIYMAYTRSKYGTGNADCILYSYDDIDITKTVKANIALLEAMHSSTQYPGVRVTKAMIKSV